jgi:hypothetical protein
VGPRKNFDGGSLLVMGMTLTLFLIALATNGFTHDLSLEAGVFLVSVKLILVGYKMSAANEAMRKRLDEIHSLLTQQGARHEDDSAAASQPGHIDTPTAKQ